MASALMHIAVAKRVIELLNDDFINCKEFYLGTIAPDVAKIVGLNRYETHFTGSKNKSAPNIESFLLKYKSCLSKPYELGYYVHLLTDELWFNEFVPNYVNDLTVTNEFGEKIKVKPEEVNNIVYNDFTNLNVQILDYYNIDLSLFYEPFNYPSVSIDVPSIYFDDLIKKMGIICSNSSKYIYIFDIKNITHFIEYAALYVVDSLKKLNI